MDIQVVAHVSVADFATEADLVAYAQANPTDWMSCPDHSDGCGYCGGHGTCPAWIHSSAHDAVDAGTVINSGDNERGFPAATTGEI